MKHGCVNCKYRFFPVTRSPCDNCAMSGNKYSEWTAQTKADRIRAMSDEELANWFAIISSSKPQSSPEWLEWLRREVDI